MENEKFEYEQNTSRDESEEIVEEIIAEYGGESNSGAEAPKKESPFADSPYESSFTTAYRAPEAEPVKQKKAKACKTGRGKRILAAVLALALVAGSCGVTAAVVNNRWENKTRVMELSINQKIKDLQDRLDAVSGGNSGVTVVDSLGNMSAGSVYAQNVQTVVLISCEVASTSYFGQTTTGTSTGSGFIISEDGYVVTNYHVVQDSRAIYVTTYNDEKYPAVLVGHDKTNDVAVLKVETESKLPYAALGSSNDLAVGDQVVAIGNPLGDLTATLTVGYVSAKDRDVTTEGATINMIQTDAAIRYQCR